MKQPFLFFSVLISLFICFSCEQILPETENTSEENVTQNETVKDDSEEKEEPTKEDLSSSFMASMRNSTQINTYIEAANEQLVEAMNATVEIKVQYQPLASVALQIQTLNREFHQHIYALKELIAQESKGVYTQFDEATKGNIDLIGMPKDGSNKEVVEQIFLSGQYGGVNTQEQQGPVLYKKLAQLREDYLNIIANMWEDGGIKGTVFADLSRREALLEQLSDNISLMDYISSEETTWIKTNFRNKTIEDAYLSLTQCQNQVNLSTAAVLNFLSEQMGRLEMNYDKFDVFAQSSKPYVLLGETYEAEIALGAYSSQAKFAVSVEGSGLSVIDGKARYSVRPSSIGEKSYNARISVSNPLTGETETFTKTFKYEVGQPAILVAADRQNILYIGIDNPITIATAGFSSSTTQISASGASLKKRSSSSYTAQVQKPGKVIISVKDIKNGKTFPFEFRAKRIPDPVVRLGTKIDGQIKSGEFKAQAGLSAPIENFDFDAKCQVQSYHLSYTRKRQDAISIEGKGGRFAGKVLDAVRQAKPGDQYSFTEVKVRCPGDRAGRRVSGLSFRIK